MFGLPRKCGGSKVGQIDRPFAYHHTAFHPHHFLVVHCAVFPTALRLLSFSQLNHHHHYHHYHHQLTFPKEPTKEQTIVLAGLAKLFVGNIVETAREVMEERGERAIMPRHLREAHRRCQTKINSTSGVGNIVGNVDTKATGRLSGSAAASATIGRHLRRLLLEQWCFLYLALDTGVATTRARRERERERVWRSFRVLRGREPGGLLGGRPQSQ